jgi:hypothetical protein
MSKTAWGGQLASGRIGASATKRQGLEELSISLGKKDSELIRKIPRDGTGSFRNEGKFTEAELGLTHQQKKGGNN